MVISSSIITGRTGDVTSMGRNEKCFQNLSENLKEENQLGDLGIDGMLK
jgi:hypothetical protein